MSKVNNEYAGIRGTPVDDNGNPIDIPEGEHFYKCSACGQAVDKCDLGQVFHHEERGHEPLDLNS